MIKMLGDLRHAQDVRSTNAFAKSSKPALSTTAILQLQQHCRERGRLLREQGRTASRLAYVEREVERAYAETLDTAATLRSAPTRGAAGKPQQRKGRATVVEY